MSVRTIELVFGETGLRCKKGDNIPFRVRENEATGVLIDVKKVVNKWTDIVLNINAKVNTATTSHTYPASINLSADENGYISWDVPGSILTAPGTMEIEVWGTSSGKTVISGTYEHDIKDSTLPDSEVPDEELSWYQQLVDIHTDVTDISEQVTADKTIIDSAKSATLAAATSAGSAKDSAIAAKTAAETAEQNAVAAKNSASGYAASALADKNLAQQAASDAASAKDTAVTAKNNAQSYAESALTHKNAAEQAATDLDAARDEAVSAKNDAVAAKETAQSAKDTAVAAQGEAINASNSANLSATLAANNLLNGVSTHNQSDAAHADIRQAIMTAESIARGRATAYVFDTLEQMMDWLAGDYERPDGATTADLITGDNLYIRDTEVKDYWWDGETAQELEAEAPDLTDYYTKTQVDAMMPILITRTAYDALVAAGTVQADRTYDIIEG